MKFLRLVLVSVLLGAVPMRAENASAPKQATGFVRSAEHADKSMACETLCAEYVPAKGAGPAVWLIGVAHIGTAEYYKALQERLDRHTIVLYEGVGLGEAVKRGPVAGMRDAGVQAGLSRALGLVFQLDAIDYTRPHFINSDVKPEKITGTARPESSNESGEKNDGKPDEKREDLAAFLMQALQGSGAIGEMMNKLVAVLGETPQMREMTKAVLVEALGSAGELMNLMREATPEMRDLLQTLLNERNAVVMADLRAQLAQRKPGETVAIFYGAAHMDELAAHLRTDLGYVPARQEWLAAFAADPEKGGISSLQLRLMMEMAKMQLRALRDTARK